MPVRQWFKVQEVSWPLGSILFFTFILAYKINYTGNVYAFRQFFYYDL